jgi:hypothetical protein
MHLIIELSSQQLYNVWASKTGQSGPIEKSTRVQDAHTIEISESGPGRA